MNRTILGAILVLTLIVLVSATTVSTMTVKPSTPKSTLVFSDSRCSGEDISEKIRTYAAKGYILKQAVGSDCNIIVVMEKY